MCACRAPRLCTRASVAPRLAPLKFHPHAPHSALNIPHPTLRTRPHSRTHAHLHSGKRLTVKHSKVTFSGYQKNFPGHGLPVTEEGQDPKAMPRAFGDLVVDFEVVFPQRLTPKQYTVLAKVLGPERTELLR